MKLIKMVARLYLQMNSCSDSTVTACSKDSAEVGRGATKDKHTQIVRIIEENVRLLAVTDCFLNELESRQFKCVT